MYSWLEMFAQSLPELVAGSTLLLGGGALTILLVPSPSHRQRIGELVIAGTLVWLLLALIPFDRIGIAKSAGRMPRISSVSSATDARPALESPPDFRETGPAAEWNSDRMSSEEIDVSFATPIESSRVQAARSGSSIAHWSILLWLGGGMLVMTWIGVSRWLLFGEVVRSEAPPEWLKRLYSPLVESRPARLLVSTRSGRPISFGLWRPTIILPRDICNPDDTSVLRHVLLHEQAHVERRDACGNSLLNAALPLLYLHPIYWWIRGRVAFSRELVADEWASGRSSRTDYIEDLVTLLKTRKHQRLAAGIGLHAVRFRSAFARRMHLLIQRKEPLTMKTSWKWRFFAGTLGVLCISFTAMHFGVRPMTANAATQSEEQPQNENVQVENEARPNSNQVTEEAPGAGSDAEGSQEIAPERQALRIVAMVMPVDDVTVPFKTDGIVASVHVEEGSVVKKNQLITRMENATVKSAAAVGKFDYLIAKETYEEGGMAVAAAKASLEVARVELEEAKELNSPPNQLRRLTLTADRAELQVELAKKAMEILFLKAKKQLDATTLAEALMNGLDGRSPIDGVVARVSCKPGEYVKAGDESVQIVSLQRVRIVGRISAHKRNADEILGQTVDVKVLRARGEEFTIPGKVDFVAPNVDESGSFRFALSCENSKVKGDWALRPGMAAVVQFQALD